MELHCTIFRPTFQRINALQILFIRSHSSAMVYSPKSTTSVPWRGAWWPLFPQWHRELDGPFPTSETFPWRHSRGRGYFSAQGPGVSTHGVENPVQSETNPMAVPTPALHHPAGPGSPLPCAQRRGSKQDKLPLKRPTPLQQFNRKPNHPF